MNLLSQIVYTITMMYIGVAFAALVFDKDVSGQSRIFFAVFLTLVTFIFFMIAFVISKEQLADIINSWNTRR